MPLPTPKLVLFDLDGTLLDTAPDLVAAVNTTLTEHGFATRELAELRAFVGMGGSRMLSAALATAHPDPAGKAQALVVRFLAHYARDVGQHIGWFDGMEQVLSTLAARDITWGIVTNKPHRLAALTVHRMAALDRCAVLIGAGVAAHAKPAPHPLRLAAARLGITPSRTWYVGDDERDVVAARAAGMAAVAAGWGYVPPDTQVDRWQADAIADTPVALLHLLQHSEPARR